MASGSTCEGNIGIPDFPGYAAFVVNIEFKGKSGLSEFITRTAAREDIGNLRTVFTGTFGFDWINKDRHSHENLSLKQWDHRKGESTPSMAACDKCLRCHIARLDHSQSKCFVLAMSSHGRELTETEIIFSDGRSLFLTEVLEALNDENCPSLKGKPRIIILQVCRSNFIDREHVNRMQDRGASINVLNTSEHAQAQTRADGSNIDDCPQTGSRFQVEIVEDQSLQQVALSKMPENYLLVYPTVPGQRAKLNKEDGSWLIHGLKKIVTEIYSSTDQSPQPIDFLRLLTQVSDHIARERESIVFQQEAESEQYKKDDEGNKIIDEDKSGFKSAVCFHHRLVEPLVFNPVVKAQEDIPNPFPSGNKKKNRKSEFVF